MRRIYIYPTFENPDRGDGGVRRAIEMQLRYLPEYGFQIISDPQEAELINIHASFVKTNSPIVFSCHGLHWEEFKWTQWAYQANRFLAEVMIRARAVTVPSEFVARVLRKNAFIDPYVCRHGVDTEYWFPPKEPGDYVLWAKNRPDPICDPSHVEIPAKLMPEQRFISTFGTASDNLTTIGKQPFSEMRKIIQQAGVFLATVIETGAITLMEAMACGVPAVGWNWGVNPEIISHKEDGWLCEPGDYDGLVEGIRYCLEHRDKLSKAARRKIVEHFQVRERIGDYIPAFEAVLRKHEGPMVSVIVTAYNLEDYLPACIQSVRSQSFQDWELIIVDDHSPDRCGEIADEASKEDNRIRVIHNRENVYLAEARNIGIRQARGKYIIPLDADDQLGEGALAELVDVLEKDSSVHIVAGGMEVVDEASGRRFISNWPPLKPSYTEQVKRHNQLPYASMYRREVWERTGGYRRRMRSAEDAEFWTRAFSYGFRPARVTSKPTLVYTSRPGSMSHTIPEPDWTAWFTWAKIPSLTPFLACEMLPGMHSYPIRIDKPLVSVVIPVGPGHELYLQDALDSVIAQTFTQWEVVVVNDTGKRWGDKPDVLMGFPFVKLIDGESRRGPSYARNRGIEAVQADYFIPLDADDYLQPNALALFYSVVRETGGWVYSDWYDELGQPHESLDWSAEELVEHGQLGPVTAIYSVEDWKRVGGFDEEAPGWEDRDFHLRLLEHGICGTRLAYPLLTYRTSTGSQRAKGFSQKQDVLRYIARKHQALFDKGEHLMGCRKCGGGGGRPTIREVAMSNNRAAPGDEPMVVVEYIGAEIQFQRVRSRVHPERYYRFGGEHGSETRRFLIYEKDADWLLANAHFRKVETSQLGVAGAGLVDTKLEAWTRQNSAVSTAKHSVPVREVLRGRINDRLIGRLEANGYTVMGDLLKADIDTLDAIWGINPQIAAQIIRDVNEFFADGES